MNRLRFGLIGFGEIGRVRARALQLSKDCSLAAIFDSDPKRTRVASGMARTFDSLDALLESDCCDAVIISTPPTSHAEVAERAMNSGKHVLVEKPISNSLESAQRMLDAATRTGRVLTVGFNHRYFKGVRDVHAAVVGGAIGQLRYVKAFAGHVGIPELRAPWMYDRAVMGGGTLMDNGTHVIDLMRFLTGDILEISANIPPPIWKVGVEEDVFVSLAFRDGVVGSLHSSWTAWQGYKFQVAAYGTNGMAMMSYAPMFSTVVTVDRGQPFRRSGRRRFYVRDIFKEKAFGWQRTVIDTFIQEISEFKALVEDTGAETRIATGMDGFKAVAIANAAYQSAATGRSTAALAPASELDAQYRPQPNGEENERR